MNITQLIVYQPVKVGQNIRSSFNIKDGYMMEYCTNYISIKYNNEVVCVGISNVAQFTPDSLKRGKNGAS